LVDSGNVRPLAIAAPKRMEAWPDVPTMTELGFAIDQRGFVGLSAPAKTPKPIVDFLSKHLNEVLHTDVFKRRMAELGMAPPPADENTPEKFDRFMREEVARQGVLAELSGQKLVTPKDTAK
jgi:tripartite-type tricarboxylate transporter receptor subunit TctC